MDHPPGRRVAVAALVLMLVGGCGGDDNESQVGEPLTSDSTTTTEAGVEDGTSTTTAARVEGTLVEITVVGGAPQGGVQRAAVKLNDKVTLRVTSDTTDEVHVHGYDLEFGVGGGVPKEVVFDATIPGVFEVELHDSGREIVKLEVSP